MNKSDLAKQLSIKANITKKKANEIIKIIFDGLTNALIDNNRIEIRGFGSFVIREYNPYIGRNPRTGHNIEVQEKRLPFFKVGKDLKEKINR
ncbi:MAG: integration host factor subunit beta [Deltaproteobacteria bacterium CG12_big_fil_rev_8_21_14_0_65_43_10]|nr:MAG: integration host factor subunit beta [Deltaproteobacteria bacterium CG2_30_43_15]PIQ45391.1 MAG: integration host factor subunit beta [Deltaproteobacteria bacterium CG12_big_fil_rev_8_21_14_0_65_43_10]PIU86576.1 MAG: integration host factor subunit beta [Deltaproteobacteria bacterium CG06_land_8_20_14_3_00_44_19]PIX25700.1 MAG: integration host factor subunit beta [Deltaproteobacteria bacterium CG_4_8_14_3_um_filter_43_13]PIZ19506.1 MAG: integration host factor subunit beta [Deltaproteo